MIMTTIAISSDVLNSVKIPCGYQERVLKPELALAFCQGGILAQHWMGKERLWPKF